MNCLRWPQSLEDAEQIIVACTGPNWRSDFILGLETVALAVLVVTVITVLLRKVT